MLVHRFVEYYGNRSKHFWKNCLVAAPDSFVLVADGNRIVMKSLVPPDRDATHYYPVIETYDPLAEIVAVTFDPVNRYVYWVDNGRQQLNSRQLDVTGKAVIRTIYNNLGTFVKKIFRTFLKL